MQTPAPPGRDIAGHLRGIFRYLTSERAAGDFDLFCTSSKSSGGVDRGIFHRGGLGQESLGRTSPARWRLTMDYKDTTNILYHLKSIVCGDVYYLTY